MFGKLALRNVRRQMGNYLIYFVTVTFSIAFVFSVNNLCYSEQVTRLSDVSMDMKTMFNIVTILSGIVIALVLSYATSFMLKLRRKELGMYFTLGMTRKDIQKLFAGETCILSGISLVTGCLLGLVLYQILVALFAYIVDMPFSTSAYSVKGIILTLFMALVLFGLSTIASRRYLKKVSINELLKVESTEKSERNLVFWGIISAISIAGFVVCIFETYQSLMASFESQEALSLMLLLLLDLMMVFLVHFALSRTIAGLLLKNRKLKNSGTNVVILRGSSAKMTVNSLMIGVLATLLVFAIVMSNIAFGQKTYSEYSIAQECPFDVIWHKAAKGDNPISMEQREQIIRKYSEIESYMDFSFYTTNDTAICSAIVGYDLMEWVDRYMSLSDFNRLLTACGFETVRLDNQFLVVSSVQGIRDTDFSGHSVMIDGTEYVWNGNNTRFPDFTRQMFYFVVPDAAVSDMVLTEHCRAYTLENPHPDAQALLEELTYFVETEDGLDEKNYYMIREYYRLYTSANDATLIIATLYISTIFVCMALAIIALKTLSSLDEEKERFAVLYRLGVDERCQKKTLLRQIGIFFMAPFLLPILMTVPLGILFGKVYNVWGLMGLDSGRAMVTSCVISLTVVCVYVLYFFITYRIACDYVVCSGAER